MLQLAIYDGPGGNLLLDASSVARGVRCTTGAHGFASLTARLAVGLAEAFRLYNRPGLPHVVLGDGASTVWEGRLEDVALSDEGVSLTALGYWRALADVPYTALWSYTGVADWETVEQLTDAATMPELYQMDTNNRLFIAPRKGEVFGTTGTAKTGQLRYRAPAGSVRALSRTVFTYDLTAAANWYAQLACFDAAGTYISSPWTLTGNGATQTGTVTATLPAGTYQVAFSLHYNAADAAYTGETGATYLRLTGLRVKSTAAATVTADAIATALASYVNGINSTQLSSSATLIGAPGVDLTDEVYEDAYPADILTRLAGLGDNQTPPAQWEVGVWEGRQLHLRVRGAAGRAWYVDAGSLSVERSLETLSNAAYGVYRDANGATQRTAVTADAGSVARYGVTRRAAVAAQTTSGTQAGVQRDAWLADRAEPPNRAAIAMATVYDGAGGRWPLWQVRSGDTITIRNLPPTLSMAVDRQRTFRVAETGYACDTDTLQVTPEAPRPTLEALLARGAL